MSTIDSTNTSPTSSYPLPVDKLLTYGRPETDEVKDWPNYLDLGLSAEHIPALIRMATDKELNQADAGNTEVWAPIHAWRTLGQLHAIEAIEPLLTLSTTEEGGEWVTEELPEVFSLLGPQALPTLEAYLSDKKHKEWSRVNAATGVKAIGVNWPDSRSASVAILTKSLENAADDESDLNSFIITELIDLEAKEAAPVIEQAFKDDHIDLSITGDWDDVRESLGLMSSEEVEQRRTDRLAKLSTLVSPSSSLIGASRSPFGFSDPSDIELPVNHARTVSHKKAKNKMAKQSRKKNRKR